MIDRSIDCIGVASEPPCDGISVAVNYLTPTDEYTLSMTTADRYGVCDPFDFHDLPKALLGSGNWWRSTCRSAVAHIMTIKPTTECRRKEWEIQYLYFELKNVKKVEVYVDDRKLYSVRFHSIKSELNLPTGPI